MSSTCRFRGVLPLALLSIQRGGGSPAVSFPPTHRPKYHSNNPANTTPSPSPSPLGPPIQPRLCPMRPSTDSPLFLTYTCDWTVNQQTNLLVLCPFSYSTLLCSALLCYSFNNNYYYYKTTSCLYSSPARVIGLVGRRTSRSVPRRNRLFERSIEPAVICTLPALALATLGLLPALLTTQRCWLL